MKEIRRIIILLMFVLSVSDAYSQIDSTLQNKVNITLDSLKIIEANILQENEKSVVKKSVKEKYYKVSLVRTDSTPRPKPGVIRPFKMIEPQTFVLTNGLKVILIQNDKLPVVSYKMYFEYSKILLGKKKGVDLIFNEIWGHGGMAFDDDNIKEYRERTGTKIEVSEESIFIEGLERYKEKNMLLLSDMTLGLNIGKEQFEDSKEKVLDSIYFSSNKNKYISETVGKKLMFGSRHLISETSNYDYVDSLSRADVIEYFRSYYNTNNAYLAVYGDISLKELKRSVNRNFGRFRKGNSKNGYYPLPYNIHNTEIDFIENYNSEDLSVWMGNVEEMDSYDRNWIIGKVGGFILFDKDKGVVSREVVKKKMVNNFDYHLIDRGKYFSLNYDAEPDSVAKSISKVLKVLNKTISPKKPDNVDLSEIESSAVNNYVRSLREPHEISKLYLYYYLTGLDEYLVTNLMSVMDTLKYSTVSNILSRRVKPNQFRIVVSGPPQKAVPKLEQLGYPIKYYDQFAKETFPPSLDRSVPDSVNVNDVLDRYIDVIGGVDNLKTVKRLLQWWVLDVDGTKLYMKNKYMLPNKRLSTYSNHEVIVLKTAFNGEYGYVEKSGKKVDIAGDEFLRLSLEKSIFPIMYYQDDGYLMTLESRIPLKGEMCYKVRVESPIGDVSLLYFRISDGYLIKRENIDPRTNKVLNYYEFSDFKTFDNIVFPYKAETMLGDKKVTLILTQIKLNDEKVRKRNFK